MKLWILSRLEQSETTKAILAAALTRGHEAGIVNPLNYHLLLSPERAQSPLLAEKNPVPQHPDAVFTRIGSSSPSVSLHILRQLEDVGITCVNSSFALERSRNKLRSYLVLAKAGIRFPKSIYSSPEAAFDSLLRELPDPPWIVKLPVSAQGKGVVFAESSRALSSILDAIHSLGKRVLVQEYIEGTEGCDLRVLVVGGKAVAGMRRRAIAGEFRSNLHRGGSAEAVALDEACCSIAEKAASSLKLDVAGVDLLESSSGPVVIEVNGSPGLEGLQSVSEKNLAEIIIEYIEGRLQA